MGEIEVVYTDSLKAICGDCGQGMFGGEPCEHKRQRRQIVTYKLYIPERGIDKPFVSVLPCPERIYVAWHKDARGVHDLLDADGHNRYGTTPRDRYWEVREYGRAMHYPGSREAFYDVVQSVAAFGEIGESNDDR